jgi:putative addiction module component (TIGR02574 family)
MKVDIGKLSTEERLALLDEIWSSLEPDEVPFTDAQRAELDRRIDELEADRELGIPWEEVLRRIRERRR